MAQNRSSAVMAQRVEPDDSLDYFPTPPWATRALCEFLGRYGSLAPLTCWEPACGEGHMVRPLRECFRRVYSSDVHDYDSADQERVSDFLLPWTVSPEAQSQGVDWIITNPPYRCAEDFALRALDIAREGVALLVRTQFLEGGGRYERLFARHQPQLILQFCERVPMFKGRLDAKGSTASSYCWVTWALCDGRALTPMTAFHWLPPCRKRLERSEDYPEPPEGEIAAAPLLDEGL